MSTPEDLKPTFSFIGAFQSEEILAPYGHNALPLFAVGLYLGVEDLVSFATDSLTPNPPKGCVGAGDGGDAKRG